MKSTPEWIKRIACKNKAKQIIVVAAVKGSTAYVSMHEDINGKWVEIMSTPGFIGKLGLGIHKEGIPNTPVGFFHFISAFGIANDPGAIIKYKKITKDDYWSGDYKCQYNKMVNIKDYPELDKEVSEHLIEYKLQYRYALSISYNEEGIAGMGSAIFLHCFGDKKPYTAGCVAIPRDKMLKVIRMVREDTLVVIDSLERLSPSLYQEWEL